MTIPADLPVRRTLVVSIHDVAPPFEDAVRAELDMLTAVGVRRRVLKVVPNWRGAHPLPEATSLIELLRAELAAGGELVLHGLEHKARGPLRGPPIQRLRARLFCPDDAEFATLGEVEAREAVRDGLDLFARAGLPPPVAFCAPGWLLTEDAVLGVRDAGIRRLIGMFSIRDLESSRRRWLPGVGYVGASPGQEIGVGILNRLVAGAVLGRATVARVYVHPQGDLNGAALRWTLSTVADMVERGHWQPGTFAELCAEPGAFDS